MSAGLLSVCRGPRNFYFFDSFEGLPPSEPIDGERAIEWQRNTKAPEYHDNNRADRSAFDWLSSRLLTIQ